jgi:hypothetical protein
MQIRSKDSGNSSEARSFSFTDAVAKYGHLLKQFELADAYRRAGNHFVGQMDQQFLVLREQGGPRIHYPAPQQQQQQQQQQHPDNQPWAGGSRKRSREDDDDVNDWSRESPPRGRGRGRGNRSGHKRPWRGNSHYRR